MNKSLQQQRAHREPRSRSEGAAAARERAARSIQRQQWWHGQTEWWWGGGDGDTLIEQSTGELLGRFPSSFVHCDAP